MEKDVTDLPPIIEDPSVPLEKSVKPTSHGLCCELDQFQEFFKEQHETSFSYVPNKNWMSFTWERWNIDQNLLFGKANYLISEHYVCNAWLVRESNPNTERLWRINIQG